jgi:hypothetical protein
METRFGIDSSEKEDWTDALIKANGSRDQECPYCGDVVRYLDQYRDEDGAEIWSIVEGFLANQQRV